MPTPVGLQDIAALIARQSFVPDSMRQRLASPFGTIHAATFTMPRPLGAIPHLPVQLIGFDPNDPEITGSVSARNRFLGAIDPEPPRVYPTVNRASKGDRLAPPLEPITAQPETPAAAPEDDTPGEGSSLETPPVYDISLSLELHPQPPIELPGDDPRTRPFEVAVPPADEAANDPATESTADATENGPAQEEHTAETAASQTPDFAADQASGGRIFFSSAPIGGRSTRIEPWAPGTTIVLESAEANDPDLKRPVAASAAGEAAAPGETVAGKGEVTGHGKRPRTPAERLGLFGQARAKAEKCLTDAVYFESRGEPVNGQIAVAQVVMNRVFSGFYPTSVCGVVYQNAHRRSACQFTFACDGIPDKVTEPEAWTRAKQIARDTLDGKLWLKHVGKSTHYHAYWVRPRWVREMMKLHRLGVHTFYRPRAWGDGSDAPAWGEAAMSEDKSAATRGHDSTGEL